MNTVPLDEMRAKFSDWRQAFHEAQHGTYGSGESLLDDVEEVVAAVAGENDGPDWIALVRLKDGRFAKVFAGCDYTGWDCRAGGGIEFYATREELLSPTTLTPEEIQRLGVDVG